MARCTSHSVVRLLLRIHSGYIQASPTLDLIRDCIQFVIAFFEVISTSAPHIFHSALPLSPQMSIIREMYNQHAAPFVRVVQGTPFSWEPAVATTHLDNFEGEAVWSPCNRFIAVVKRESVEVLDAVTLSRLNIFGRCPDVLGVLLGFSSDGRRLSLLTSVSVVSWDLQTGGPLGTIPPPRSPFATMPAKPLSFTHSDDGEMVAVAYRGWYDMGSYFSRDRSDFICTYDLPCGKCGSRQHALDSEGLPIYQIWTRDKYLRFATIKPGFIIIWEAEFTLTDPPVEVTHLPVPDGIIRASRFLFLPSLSRLAFVLDDTIQVWDLKPKAPPKLLLKSELTLQSPSNKFDPPAVHSPPMAVYLHIRTPVEKSMFGRCPPLAISFTNSSHSSPPSPPQGHSSPQMENRSSYLSVQKFIDGIQEIKFPLSPALQLTGTTSSWGFPPMGSLQPSYGGRETRSQLLTSNLANRGVSPTLVWEVFVWGWLRTLSLLLVRRRSLRGTCMVGIVPSTTASTTAFRPPFPIVHCCLATQTCPPTCRYLLTSAASSSRGNFRCHGVAAWRLAMCPPGRVLQGLQQPMC